MHARTDAPTQTRLLRAVCDASSRYAYSIHGYTSALWGERERTPPVVNLVTSGGAKVLYMTVTVLCTALVI